MQKTTLQHNQQAVKPKKQWQTPEVYLISTDTVSGGNATKVREQTLLSSRLTNSFFGAPYWFFHTKDGGHKTGNFNKDNYLVS